MARYGRVMGVALAALAAFAVATLLRAAPETVRWALLICLMGFVGATLRLRHLDAGL